MADWPDDEYALIDDVAAPSSDSSEAFIQIGQSALDLRREVARMYESSTLID